jgi:purine-cytosine permease-like protein
MALSLVNANTFNAYTGSFQVLAFGSMWRRYRSESVTVRLIPFLFVMAAGVVIAVLGYRQFVTNLTNFLDVLLVLFIPGSAVNLADYFLSAAAPTTSPRSSPPTASTAGSPGAGWWPTRSGWPRNGPWSPSPTTPARSSRPSAAPTSPGSSAGSLPLSSTYSW